MHVGHYIFHKACNLIFIVEKVRHIFVISITYNQQFESMVEAVIVLAKQCTGFCKGFHIFFRAQSSTISYHHISRAVAKPLLCEEFLSSCGYRKSIAVNAQRNYSFLCFNVFTEQFLSNSFRRNEQMVAFIVKIPAEIGNQSDQLI